VQIVSLTKRVSVVYKPAVDLDEELNYIIKDRICIMKFTQEQWDRHPEFKNPAEDLRKAITLKVTAYILAGEQTITDVRKTAESLLKQILQPKLINVIIYGDTVKGGQLANIFRELEKDYPDLAWQLTTIHDRDEDGSKPSIEWCIDHAVANCKTSGYCTFHAGFEVPSTYLSDIDKALNDDLIQFIALEPINNEEWNGAFIHLGAHKMVEGNRPIKLEEYEDGALIADTVYDKLIHITKQENQGHLVKKVEEICSAMKSI
jgi:hypothetical protein